MRYDQPFMHGRICEVLILLQYLLNVLAYEAFLVIKKTQLAKCWCFLRNITLLKEYTFSWLDVLGKTINIHQITCYVILLVKIVRIQPKFIVILRVCFN